MPTFTNIKNTAAFLALGALAMSVCAVNTVSNNVAAPSEQVVNESTMPAMELYNPSKHKAMEALGYLREKGFSEVEIINDSLTCPVGSKIANRFKGLDPQGHEVVGNVCADAWFSDDKLATVPAKKARM